MKIMEKHNTVIEMKHIVKDFNGFKANNDIHLKLHQGEILALLGENGAGKSTFLRLLSGVYKADKGNILIDEEPVYNNQEAKNKMVFVSDDLYFLPGASLKRMSAFYKSFYSRYDDKKFDKLGILLVSH